MSHAQQTILLILIPAGYLVGSIPFGLLVGLARGVDVRQKGSGNIGATNVGRLLGGKFFALVFALDVLKGMAPMLAAGLVLGFAAHTPLGYLLWLLVGFAAVLGHMFSVFLGFRGGKGVATSTGMMLGLWPYYTLPLLAAAAVFGAAFWRTRIVSLGSILGAITLPIAYAAMGLLFWPTHLPAQWPLLAFAVIVATMIVYKHRSNITRLRAGNEPRVKRRVGSNGDGDPSDDPGHADTDGDDGDGTDRPRPFRSRGNS